MPLNGKTEDIYHLPLKSKTGHLPSALNGKTEDIYHLPLNGKTEDIYHLPGKQTIARRWHPGVVNTHGHQQASRFMQSLSPCTPQPQGSGPSI